MTLLADTSPLAFPVLQATGSPARREGKRGPGTARVAGNPR
ncbi:hypothetical protein CSB89_2458 [Pseudomonas aeruginosa]|nr:hypothetical protein HMPREF3150_00175 [Pseudomonas aeruginosa]RAL77369.1 hypothetical protein CSC34_6564 [Pseudomonas aeruginosa]RCG93360.1 hypothetical protein CSB89_2458 [Pseudomonas aeruginosa]RCH39940.1 hypothetical protein CSC45_2544 [Pseudomonas aeruginosa]